MNVMPKMMSNSMLHRLLLQQWTQRQSKWSVAPRLDDLPLKMCPSAWILHNSWTIPIFIDMSRLEKKVEQERIVMTRLRMNIGSQHDSTETIFIKNGIYSCCKTNARNADFHSDSPQDHDIHPCQSGWTDCLRIRLVVQNAKGQTCTTSCCTATSPFQSIIQQEVCCLSVLGSPSTSTRNVVICWASGRV